ncbi:MAG TPA: ABC transporter substrate-binding protein, partial [Acidobacteriaceae bacterium]|nr:ABC transporter substrate-binding protein [Acidobacteriaceae bacterium]
RELIKAGVEVWISNHRSVDGILAYIRRLGAMVGAHEKAERYAQRAERHIAGIRAAAASLPRRPKVYFEEWDEPIISS